MSVVGRRTENTVSCSSVHTFYITSSNVYAKLR